MTARLLMVAAGGFYIILREGNVVMVLVLDDSDTMRQVFVQILLEIGLKEDEIQEAADGATAISLLKSHTFSLCLLDIVMGGIDGIGVLKKVKEIQPEAKVIMCSSFGESGTVKDLIDMGIDDFVLKPYEPARLKDTLSRHLGLA